MSKDVQKSKKKFNSMPIEQEFDDIHEIPVHKSYVDKMEETPYKKSRQKPKSRKKMEWNKHIFKPLDLFFKKHFPESKVNLRYLFQDNVGMKQEYMDIWQLRSENPSKYNKRRIKFLEKHTKVVRQSTELSL